LAGDHPLAVPCNPSLAASHALISESDVILAIGTEFGPTDYDWYETGLAKIAGKLIRVDLDPEQAMRGYIADCVILADADVTVRALHAAIPETLTADGARRAKSTRDRVAKDDVNRVYRASLALLETVNTTLPDAVIVGDSAQPVYAASVAYAAPDVRRFFSSSTGYGTLGYAMPAAIGAKLGVPNAPVIALVGDGGYLFSSAELSSALEAKTPIIILLWNNQGYGEIKNYMVSKQIAPIGVDITIPDFIALAKAHGAEANKLQRADDLPQLLIDASKRNVPTLIEIDQTEYVAARG
jgi:acetolactate synthase-1/2/3 large subunit